MTANTPRIKLQDTQWKPGRVRSYGQRDHITAEAIGVGHVRLVYDRDRSGVMLVGVERLVASGDADLPPRVEHVGYDAVPHAVSRRIYRAEIKRRSVIR